MSFHVLQFVTQIWDLDTLGSTYNNVDVQIVQVHDEYVLNVQS